MATITCPIFIPVEFFRCASVLLSKDGKKRVETAADIDGKYKLEEISPRSYTLKIKVVGYDSLTISDVTIHANSRLTMNLEVSSKRDQNDRFMPIPNYYPKKKAPVICPAAPPDLKALPERKFHLR